MVLAYNSSHDLFYRTRPEALLRAQTKIRLWDVRIAKRHLAKAKLTT